MGTVGGGLMRLVLDQGAGSWVFLGLLSVCATLLLTGAHVAWVKRDMGAAGKHACSIFPLFASAQEG